MSVLQDSTCFRAASVETQAQKHCLSGGPVHPVLPGPVSPDAAAGPADAHPRPPPTSPSLPAAHNSTRMRDAAWPLALLSPPSPLSPARAEGEACCSLSSVSTQPLCADCKQHRLQLPALKAAFHRNWSSSGHLSICLPAGRTHEPYSTPTRRSCADVAGLAGCGFAGGRSTCGTSLWPSMS